MTLDELFNKIQSWDEVNEEIPVEEDLITNETNLTDIEEEFLTEENTIANEEDINEYKIDVCNNLEENINITIEDTNYNQHFKTNLIIKRDAT